MKIYKNSPSKWKGCMRCTERENPGEKENGSAEALAVYEGGYVDPDERKRGSGKAAKISVAGF